MAGIGALIAGHADLAALAALAGLFAIAHAADLDPRRDAAYRAVAWIVPIGSAAMFFFLGWVISTSEYTGRTRALGLLMSGLGGAASIAAAFRPFANELARSLFAVDVPSRVLRLAGRLAILGTLLSVPAGLAFPVAAQQLQENGGSLVGGAGSLWANLAGLVLLAFGGVGFTVRRTWSETTERLGLLRLEPRHALVIVTGVALMLIVNAGAEWVQRTWFPGLWASDQKVNQMIAGNLTRSETLLLGLSAGFGEEIALRGALQPKLGIFRMLAGISDLTDVDTFVREWLGSLLDYDARRKAELVHTLTQYLEHGGNYDATAAELSVHKSTLKYRLQRIRELTGLELNDPDVHFNLQLATRAWGTLQALHDER